RCGSWRGRWCRRVIATAAARGGERKKNRQASERGGLGLVSRILLLPGFPTGGRPQAAVRRFRAGRRSRRLGANGVHARRAGGSMQRLQDATEALDVERF